MSNDRHPICPQCNGTTVMLRGSGLDMQYQICPAWNDPGHLSEPEIKQRIADIRARLRPSGRFA